MEQKLDENKVYDAVKAAFRNLHVLVREELKKHWKTMNRESRYAAGRALVFMAEVEKNPAAYFSRVGTEKDWVSRAKQFATQRGVDDIADAFYIVQDPKGVVWNHAMAALRGDLAGEYYRFCADVQDWEYKRTSKIPHVRALTEKSVDEIMKKSKKFQKKADLQKANVVLKPFVYVTQQFQR